jgi:short-subunit dehydrogenase
MSNKIVFISGSSDGLGKEIAIKMAENNHHILLHGRDEKKLLKTQKIIKKFNVNCDLFLGNLLDNSNIEKLVTLLIAKKVDIIINNAAEYNSEEFDKILLDKFEQIIELNFLVPVKIIHGVFQYFKKRRRGVIININSLAGKKPGLNETAYCASKFALRGFSQSLALEANKYNIRIIDVYPGSIKTQMVRHRSSFDKFMNPSEIANIIYNISKMYKTSRISEIEITRTIY